MFGLITIFFLSVIALFVTANASDEWLDITKYSQDLKTNPILTPSDRFEWILGDPTILDIGDRRYVLANEIFHGIIVYRQSSDSQLNGDEGEFNYEKVGAAVGHPGAVRPYCYVEDDTIYLFYEQYTLRSFFANSVLMMKTGRLTDEGDLEWNKDETVVLKPELEWEKENSSRVGNAFVFFNDREQKYFLYYSASSQLLPDSKVAEPIYLGLATADDMKGPWTRYSNKPINIEGLGGIEGEDTTGVGSFKLIKGIEQNYNSFVGLINRITKDKTSGATGSTISLVVSKDGGKSLQVVEPFLITPTLIEGDWKESYCYGFDTGLDHDDAENYILVMYNGRDGWAKAKETVGVTRILKETFLQYQ